MTIGITGRMYVLVDYLVSLSNAPSHSLHRHHKEMEMLMYIWFFYEMYVHTILEV